MKKRKLGELEVSAIGYGCMGLSHGYGLALPEEDAVNLIRSAYDTGCTLFDTAEIYTGEFRDGSPANNEELVGQAVKPFREKIILATKCGIVNRGDRKVLDASRASIRQSIEGSLRRLQTDFIDLYYLHREDPETPPEEVAEIMAELIREGKIRYWGISNASAEFISRAASVLKPAAVQMRYSMLDHKNEELFPMLEELNIGFTAYSPLANGFLTAGEKPQAGSFHPLDHRNDKLQYTPEGSGKARGVTGLIGRMAKEKNASPSQIALAWMLCKKPWIVPIPGTTKTERILENAGAEDVFLSEEEIREIDTALAGMDLEAFERQK